MQSFATLIAFACLFWSTMSFCFAVVYTLAGNDTKANGCEGSSVAWAIAAGVFLIAAK